MTMMMMTTAEGEKNEVGDAADAAAAKEDSHQRRSERCGVVGDPENDSCTAERSSSASSSNCSGIAMTTSSGEDEDDDDDINIDDDDDDGDGSGRNSSSSVSSGSGKNNASERKGDDEFIVRRLLLCHDDDDNSGDAAISGRIRWDTATPGNVVVVDGAVRLSMAIANYRHSSWLGLDKFH